MDKKKLQQALERVKPGLASRELIEQTTSFAFIDGKVVTYNDDISISHPIEGLEIEGVVKADKLLSLLSKIKIDEIELVIDKNQLRIVAGRSKAGVPLQEFKLPVKEAIGKMKEFKPLPANFNKQLALSIGATANDLSRPKFNCIRVSENILEATDGYKIMNCQLDGKVLIKEFLLPNRSAIGVIKIEPDQIAEGKGWIHFKNSTSGTIISCRIIEEEFPDMSSHLCLTGKEIALPKSIKEVIERARIFTESETQINEMVQISIGNKRLKVESECAGGWFKEEINIKYEDEVLNFAIAPYLLKSILDITNVCQFCNGKLKFEGPDWIYIVCLKTMKKTEPVEDDLPF